jgi:CO/xanthine dehydrogenase Mo-binding subunit
MSIGHSPTRVDVRPKAAGRARYVDDLVLPGMLHAALATAPTPHGRLLELDTSEAAAMPGVVAVLTAADVPGENQVGCVFPDQPLLVDEAFRFLGDRLAIVVASSREAANRAAKRVRVRHEALPVVTDPVAALEPESPQAHPKGNLIAHQVVRKGDVDRAFADAEIVLEGVWQAPYQEHAYLENNGVVAIPEADGGLTLHVSMQCPWYVQGAVARVLGLPLAAVRVIQATTGGAFGGKEDYPSEPAACAAVAAHRLGRPVKLIFERGDDMVRSTKRHRVRTHLRVAARSDGTLLGVEATLHVDAGAYAGLSTVVAERANISAVGPYRVENARVDTYVVRTNNLFGGAFRGFGHPQVAFAFESMIDELALRLGLDPGVLRLKNAAGPDDTALSGQPLAGSGPIRRVLEEALAASDFSARREALTASNAAGGPTRRGLGLGYILYGVGLHAGGQHLEGSGALVQLLRDGSAQVAIGGTEIGQGAATVCAQIAAELLAVPLDRVRVLPTDTGVLPDSGPTVASRTTLLSGNAVKDAASRIRERLLPIAAELLGVHPDRIESTAGAWRDPESGREVSTVEVAGLAWRRKQKLAESGWWAPPPKRWDPARGQGDAYLVYAAAAHVAEVEVDLASGEARALKVWAVHDVGRALHPDMLRGQVYGGVAQGVGYALMEDLQLKDGVPLNANFTDYLIPTTLDMPDVDVIIVEEPFKDGPFGAKGVGEPALIPCPAAVANAMSHACGVRFRELPITPERVLAATSRFMPR